ILSMLTFPCHQFGFAENSTPRVGSKLSTFHGPVAMVSTFALPNVPLFFSAKAFEKIPACGKAAVYCQAAFGFFRRTVTVDGPLAVALLKSANFPKAPTLPGRPS